jgi:hypothetical protein
MYFMRIGLAVAGIVLATSPTYAMVEILGGTYLAVAEVRINDELVRNVDQGVGLGGGAQSSLRTPIAFAIVEASYGVRLDDLFISERITVEGFASEQSDLVPPPTGTLTISTFASVDATVLFRISEVRVDVVVSKEDFRGDNVSAEVSDAASGEIVIPSDARQGESFLLATGDYEVRWHHDWGVPDRSPDGSASFPKLSLFATAVPEPGSMIVWSVLGISLLGFASTRRLRRRG